MVASMKQGACADPKTSQGAKTAGRLSRRRALQLGAAAAALEFAPARIARAQGPTRDLAATTGMVADAVRVLLGGSSAFGVTALMGSGVDPHGYRETRADIALLLEAEAIFWNGLYLEAQLEELMGALAAQKPVFALGEAVPVDLRRAHDIYENRYDPHVWMDPTLWAYAIEAARAGLSDIAPAEADTIAENAARYAEETAALDAYARIVLESVPEERRVLITAHDAFGYFGRAYGFDVVGVQGVSTESEAGLARIRQIVDLIVERGVSAVFVETSVSDRNVRALIEGARARGADVALGASLFSDAMGRDGTYEGTYLGMIDHNVTAIALALGGEAPARGRLGRLAEEA